MEKFFSRWFSNVSPLEWALVGLGVIGVAITIALDSREASAGFFLGVLYVLLTARSTRSILANISEGRSRNAGIIPVSVGKVVVIGLLLYLITGARPAVSIAAFLAGIGISLPAAFIVFQFARRERGN